MSRENSTVMIPASASWRNNYYPINFNYTEKTNSAWEKKQDVYVLSAGSYMKLNLSLQ